eukprot:1393600-Amorphochlora_amoeboformis.AAC.2
MWHHQRFHTSFFSTQETKVQEQVDTTTMYATLELSKDANQTQIKRAFHKLAKEYHPDRGGCEEKETIRYVRGGGSSKWREGDGGFRMPWYIPEAEEDRGLAIPAESPAQGVLQRIEAHASVNEGENMPELQRVGNNCLLDVLLMLGILLRFGGKPEGIVICKDCEGRGIRIIHGGGQPLPHYEPCTSCNRSGKSIHPQFVCNVCQGRRVVKSTKRLEVVIGKGMCGGNKRIFPQEANEEPGALPGDVIVTFDEQDHKNFKREGIHLRVKKTITLMEAFGGFKFTIKHLDNRLLAIRSEPGVVYKPGDVKTIREEGMPAPRDPFTFGNLFVQFEVAFPDRMSHEHLQ